MEGHNEEEDEREAKKQRQKKKMTKILIKAWNLDDAKPFFHAEELSATDLEHHKTGPRNLTSMGEKLDTGDYACGTTGWEIFALDLSWIYRRFIMSGKHTKLAQRHLEEIQGLLENVLPSLSDIAKGDIVETNTTTVSIAGKKRAASPVKEPNHTKTPQAPAKPSPKKKGRTLGKKKAKTQQTKREGKSEMSKLQKELDKAVKAHDKASKSLESFLNETHNDLSTMEEDGGVQGDDDDKGPNPRRILGNYDFDIFQGMPSICGPDILMVWDFLCTFSRMLSLEPIGLDDFVKALLYSPKPDNKNDADLSLTPPLYLAEAHLALLKLLLSDVSSDEWWSNMLEKIETQTTSTMDVDSSIHEIHYIDPVIKIDVLALLSAPEDSTITNRWLQELEPLLYPTRKISSRKVKSVLKSAMSLTSNKYVKLYLYKCIQKRRLSESVVKDAIGWLVARVRQARLDLQDHQVDKGILMEHIQKIAQESKDRMEQLHEEEDEEDIDFDALDDWDDDSESEDESESENEEDLEVSRKGSSRNTAGQTDESALVTSSVPELPTPTLIDILLPSNKHTLNSEILSPCTWPPIAGIAARRILYRLKWLRNEVDDNLREFREKPRLTIAERKRRELIAPFRILSESVSVVEEGDRSPLESAISHLCDGKPYLDLRPVQRLCILRVLVEASYDTDHIYNCVQDNIKSRTSAEKSLEQEERQLKKEAKEEATVVEESARSRLLDDAKRSFIERKRKELAQNNKRKRGYSEQQILTLSDDQVAAFDEDTKVALEALNTQSFSKSEVSAMVSKINDENAFGKKSVEILTLDEIQRREEKELADMSEELESYGNNFDPYDRSVSARVDKLRKEIANYKEWLISLPKLRTEAIATLKDAIQDGTMKVLKSAIRNAKEALLMGDASGGDGIWAFELLRDAFLELKAAERRKRVIEAQKDLIGKRNKCFVRTEPIGSDRFLSKYWHFDHDVAGRLWVETDFDLGMDTKDSNRSVIAITDTDYLKIGPGEEEEDLLPTEIKTDYFTQYVCQEYHPSGLISSLVKRSCGFYITEKSLRSLIKNMDSKRKREAALKEELKKILESSGAITSSNDESLQRLSEHEDRVVFQEAKASYLSSLVDEDGIVKDYLLNLSSAIGQDILLSQSFTESSDLDDTSHLCFKVTGWTMKTEESSLTLVPVWLASSEAAVDVEIPTQNLFEGLARAAKHRNHNQADLSSLSDYRNKLGKFCGRAADAPYSMTVFSLSKLLLKREQDLYPSLKSRLAAADNHWGGKNGLKNAWIVSLRDYGDRFETVKDCCLLLEAAFFEFCGGVADNHSDEMISSAMQLFNDPKGRGSVALETKGPKRGGLWNSKESRLIFRELVSSSKTVGTLALCIELLCTNCRSYLEVIKANPRLMQDNADFAYPMRVTRGNLNSQTAIQQPNAPRRLNAWQQQQSYY